MFLPNKHYRPFRCLYFAVLLAFAAVPPGAAESVGGALTAALPTLQVISQDANYPLDQSLGVGDHTSVVAHVGQAFVVTAQYPASLAASEVVVDALDGGKIDGQSYRKLKVGATGVLTFRFTAGQNLGGYQVELRGDRGTASLLFSVEAVQTNP